MEWSPQQQGALDAVNKWFKEKRSPQIFRLFGYAGTGKTTLAKHFAQGIVGDVAYMAFTGKAALELRRKGCDDASTIHSAIYRPVEDPVTGITKFELNSDSPVGNVSLIIVDEVSFVGEALAKDLMSFGVKILVLGDPAQLPPIGEDGYFINAEPDYFLTEIHRQAQDNPIIWMSMQVREGKILKPGNYGESRVLLRKNLDPVELKDMALNADQVICGMNKTRHSLNKSIRKLKGKQGDRADYHPTIDDKIICLRNMAQKGFLNGGMWTITKDPTFIAYEPTHHRFIVKSEDDPRLKHVQVKVLDGYFLGTDGDYDWKIKKRFDEFTYGYAITCHKAQGSQWENIMLFDESSVFRDTAMNWLYTGITRAADRVDVLV